MEYNKGDIAKAKIIKINDNGCLFKLYQGKGQRGFMPNYLMTSFFDDDDLEKYVSCGQEI